MTGRQDVGGRAADGAYDAIVIGGGPAGSATATLLSREGNLRVLLLERERFPRFRIGESLMPATWWSFERLGILGTLAASPFPRKHSVQFYLKDGRPTAPFYFSDADPHERSVTWQVDRASFDRMLLDHAAACGVEVRHEASVAEVLFDGSRAVGVRGESPRGSFEVRARVIVDATGQSGLMSRALGLKIDDPKLRNAAVFTRYRGARRDPGRDEGATLVLHTDNEKAWFWWIPLPDDTVSVGVVGSLEYIVKSRNGSPREVYDEELARCPALKARLEGAVECAELRALKDFSYISRRAAGDGWILVGDAFGFLDPIYSSGVLLAFKSAEFAADAILEGFREGDLGAAKLGRYAPRYVAGMEALRRLVYAFYAPEFSFAAFLARHPEHRAGITNMLMGNVFRMEFDTLLRDMDAFQPLPDYRPLSLPAEPA